MDLRRPLEDAVTHLVKRFGAGETLTRAGRSVDALSYILDGEVQLSQGTGGQRVVYGTLTSSEPVGLGAYSRQPETDTATARSIVHLVSPLTSAASPTHARHSWRRFSSENS